MNGKLCEDKKGSSHGACHGADVEFSWRVRKPW